MRRNRPNAPGTGGRLQCIAHAAYVGVGVGAGPEGGGPESSQGLKFAFGTFGFPPLDADVVEYAEPTDTTPGRLSWTAGQDGGADEKLDVLHAWLVEDLPGGRVRILTQVSQIGKPAADLTAQTPRRPTPCSTAIRRGSTAS
ncbi:hypothetical protein [Streptomyces sp. NPDC059639]|uniref:hypothetical protein n=1 Tax=Streptomyces sp. NPDC059639 TaxID=3346891 RepID=UPI0036892BEA